MKKIAIVLAVVLIFCFALTSCGNSVVGTWADSTGLTSYTFDKDGNVTFSVAGVKVSGVYEITGKTELEITVSALGVVSSTNKHTYSVDGNKLTLDGVTLIKAD